MSKDIRKLMLSQGIANLADVFFRVVVIANVFVLSGSVISTSLVPILIGLSSFFSQFPCPISNEEISFKSCSFLDTIW